MDVWNMQLIGMGEIAVRKERCWFKIGRDSREEAEAFPAG